MCKTIFNCEVITPMFMAGGDGKTPELRPSEFKGMMRFWWRAIKAENDIDKLRKEEAEIFGSSDEKIGKSKFSLKITQNQNIASNYYSPLPHSAIKRFKFQGLSPGNKFEIILSCRSGVEKLGNILEISSILGGFGKRSRRGFGSIHLEKWSFKNEGILREYILVKLNSINNDFEIQNNAIIKKTGVDANYPYIKQISFGKNIPKLDDLLSKIGQASHTHSDKALGSASPRMASPIYVSVVKLSNGFISIITTLNPAFPSNYKYDLKKQKSFIEELMK